MAPASRPCLLHDIRYGSGICLLTVLIIWLVLATGCNRGEDIHRPAFCFRYSYAYVKLPMNSRDRGPAIATANWACRTSVVTREYAECIIGNSASLEIMRCERL